MNEKQYIEYRKQVAKQLIESGYYTNEEEAQKAIDGITKRNLMGEYEDAIQNK